VNAWCLKTQLVGGGKKENREREEQSTKSVSVYERETERQRDQERGERVGVRTRAKRVSACSYVSTCVSVWVRVCV
jgi:hypothetical protein